MAETTVTLHRDDQFQVGLLGTLYGRVHVGDLLIAGGTPDVLERLGEAFLTAGRDLKMAQTNASLSSMFDGTDNTAAAMAYVQEKRAKADAAQRDEEMRAQESVDLADEREWGAA